MKEELLKKRQELMDRVEAIRADYRRGLDKDSEEQAVQLENRDTLHEIERVSLEEIARIDQQLKILCMKSKESASRKLPGSINSSRSWIEPPL